MAVSNFKQSNLPMGIASVEYLILLWKVLLFSIEDTFTRILSVQDEREIKMKWLVESQQILGLFMELIFYFTLLSELA